MTAVLILKLLLSIYGNLVTVIWSSTVACPYLQVTEQVMDEKLGRTVTRVVLPRVVMHARHHYAVLNFFFFFQYLQ